MTLPKETIIEKLKERYGYTAAKVEQIITEYEEIGKAGDLQDFSAALMTIERDV